MRLYAQNKLKKARLVNSPVLQRSSESRQPFALPSQSHSLLPHSLYASHGSPEDASISLKRFYSFSRLNEAQSFQRNRIFEETKGSDDKKDRKPLVHQAPLQVSPSGL